MKWSEVLVARTCPTLGDPMDCSLPGSSVHGILQGRILEWVAIPFSRGSSWPRDGTQVSCIAGRFFSVCVTRKAHYNPQSIWRPSFTSALHINFPFPLKEILQEIAKNVPLVFKCSPSDEPKCTFFLPYRIPWRSLKSLGSSFSSLWPLRGCHTRPQVEAGPSEQSVRWSQAGTSSVDWLTYAIRFSWRQSNICPKIRAMNLQLRAIAELGEI